MSKNPKTENTNPIITLIYNKATYRPDFHECRVSSILSDNLLLQAHRLLASRSTYCTQTYIHAKCFHSSVLPVPLPIFLSYGKLALKEGAILSFIKDLSPKTNNETNKNN